MPVFHWSCSSVHDLMRQCLPELADTILQAWEAYQCSRRGTHLPFLLSGKEVSERKRQQRLIKTLQIYSFLPPPDRLKSQLSNPLRVRFSRSLCILVWSCQIRVSQRVVPELPSLSTVYGLFHPLFCHSGHQFIHCPQVHRPPQVI